MQDCTVLEKALTTLHAIVVKADPVKCFYCYLLYKNITYFCSIQQTTHRISAEKRLLVLYKNEAVIRESKD